MPILELSETQGVDLVKQLPPDKQRVALLALAEGAAKRREKRMQLAAERRRDWDKMSEEDRETFMDDLVHEERVCGK